MRWLMVAVLLAAPETKPSRDQAMRQLIDRQNQIASLLTAGRLAWDAGDFSTAAARWEALLRVEGLPADVERAVRPFAVEARSKTGAPHAPRQTEIRRPDRGRRAAKPAGERAGTVSGCGGSGAGRRGDHMKRADGWTPKPQPLQSR
jgi:hypothetical protein